MVLFQMPAHPKRNNLDQQFAPTLFERLAGINVTGETSLLRRLSALLNAQRPAHLSEGTLDAGSPLTYGLGAEWSTLLNPQDPCLVDAFCLDVARTIERHEPRLADVTVAPAAAADGLLTVRITAAPATRTVARVAFFARVAHQRIDVQEDNS